MSSPLVTVITAVRDGAAYLRETIDSVRSQTVEDWEYLIVDDGSSDASPTIAASAAEQDGRIRLMRRTASGGPYVAANDGLREARGRFVARVDADDVCLPHRLARQIDFIEQTGLRAAAARTRPMTAAGVVMREDRAVPTTSGALRWYLCPLGGLRHSTAFVERAAFESIGGYRPMRTSADYGMWCDLARRGWLGVLPEVVLLKRWHPDNISATASQTQRGNRISLMADHLLSLTGTVWTEAELWMLYTAARGEPTDLDGGLRVIDRWTLAWRRDASLTGAERRILSRLSTRLRLRHLRRNGRREPVATAVELARTGVGMMRR